MKILYYAPDPHLNLASPAGYGTHMRETIAAFEAQGHQVIRRIMGGEEPSKSSNRVSKARSILRSLVPTKVWATLRDVKLVRFDEEASTSLVGLLEKEKPDIVYERVAYLQHSGVRAAHRAGVFHVAEINAPYVEERVQLMGRTMMRSRAQSVEREIFEKSDCFVLVSTALKEYFQSLYNVTDEKILVVPNGVTLNNIPKESKKAISSPLTVGFVGSIFRWHGVDLLIQAFHACLKDHENLRLLIVGDGYVRPELEKQVRSLGIENCVTFAGNVPPGEVYNYIDQMDICVSPNSHWYGSPVKIFEYGAMGKAIIAPDNVPVNDVMTDRVHGLLVKPNVTDIQRALGELIRDSNLRSRLATTFRDKVHAEHTWQKNTEKILQKVDQMVEKKREKNVA